MTLTEAKRRIDAIMSTYRDALTARTASVLPDSVTQGKIYEAWVLTRVLESLRNEEGYAVALRNQDRVVLKSSPGPINRRYPYFHLSQGGRPDLEVWTDVEFHAMSWHYRQSATEPGDFHELDILVVPAIGLQDRPAHHQVLLGVECKATRFEKHMLRGVLGVRRELSLYMPEECDTAFLKWPRPRVPANPASCLMVYATDEAVLTMAGPGATFGIDFRYEPLP